MWWNLFNLYCFVTKVHALIGRHTLIYIYLLHDSYRYVFHILFCSFLQCSTRGWIDIWYQCNKKDHETDDTAILVFPYRHWCKFCKLFIVSCILFLLQFAKPKNSWQTPKSLFSMKFKSRFVIKEAYIQYSGKMPWQPKS